MLIVDDNESARDVLAGYVEDFSFEATAVSTGEKALEEVQRVMASGERRFDLVLMDYQMPGMNGVKTAQKIRDALPVGELPRIILVTAHGREEILKQGEDAGLDGFLLKPVSQSLLYNTILEAFGDAVKDGVHAAGEAMPEGFEAIRGARILLAEDNEINQQVAVETLQAEGFFVDVASHGRAAVEKVGERTREFDVVLMDLQMPVMDGYEATVEIRKSVEASELPIIAMTADAMSGVREQVLDTGMNDYVTKPIEPAELWAALVKWIKPGTRELPDGFQESGEAAAVPSALPGIEGINAEDGLRRVGGNHTLYRELLVKFRRDFADSADEIRKQLAAGDLQTAERLAHTVKGVAGNIGAGELQSKATQLDDVLKQESQADYEVQLGEFEVVLQSLVDALSRAGLEKVEQVGPAVGTREPITPERLRELLVELEPNLKKRQPKRCVPVLGQISAYALPEEYEGDIVNLAELIKRYKFKEAQALFDRLMEMVE